MDTDSRAMALGAADLFELLGGRRAAKTNKRTTAMDPGVPGSRSERNRLENRRPGGQRWQAADGSLHRDRKTAVRRGGEPAVLVAVPPRSSYITDSYTGEMRQHGI